MAKDILTVSQFCDYGEIVGALISEFQAIIAMDVQTHAEIFARLNALKMAGELADFSPYWQNGRYLYKSYLACSKRPRWRQYVGMKPERINEALEAVERRKKYCRLQREQKAIERRIQLAAKRLTSLINLTKGQL